MSITIHTEAELVPLEERLIEAALGRGLVDPSSSLVLTRDQVESNVRHQINRLRSDLGFPLVLGPTPAVLELTGPDPVLGFFQP